MTEHILTPDQNNEIELVQSSIASLSNKLNRFQTELADIQAAIQRITFGQRNFELEERENNTKILIATIEAQLAEKNQKILELKSKAA